MEDWFGDSKKYLREELKKENECRYFAVKSCGNCSFIHKLDTQEKVIVYCSCPLNCSFLDTHNRIIAEVEVVPGESRSIDLTEFPKWCKLTKYKDLMIGKKYKKDMLSWWDSKKIKELIK